MFSLDESQQTKLVAWIEGQEGKVLAKQREQCPERTVAYYGCSGGAYTYLFTPTTLGTVVRVRNRVTEEEIDLTDYDMW